MLGEVEVCASEVDAHTKKKGGWGRPPKHRGTLAAADPGDPSPDCVWVKVASDPQQPEETNRRRVEGTENPHKRRKTGRLT